MRVASQIDVVSPQDEADCSDPLPPTVEPPMGSLLGLGVVVGELIALTDDGQTPVVIYPGQRGSAAIRARTVVDLHATHIGRPVVLVFEGSDSAKPIVVGVLRPAMGWPAERTPPQVEVESDGERVVVTAAEQLVLRCGKSSITLTKAGKVVIEGRYILSKSAGVNRVKGGSVQLN